MGQQGIEIRQLTTEDMVSFQCAMASYKTMGQQMLDVFNSITRDLISRLPERFTYTGCGIMMTNCLDGYGDESCVALYDAEHRYPKPVWIDWIQSGECISGYITATRREVIEVIRQFKPFLEQLSQELSKDNNEIADHVKRLKAIWAEINAHE